MPQPPHGNATDDRYSRTLPASLSIVLQNLVKFFGRFAALRDISDSFAPGRLYVVIGDNGAGKSTLLRVVAGLMEPSQGSVTLLGATNARDVAHRVGYMGHAALLYDELSGMENLRYFAGLYGLGDDTAVAARDANRSDSIRNWNAASDNIRRACGRGCRWPGRCCTIRN